MKARSLAALALVSFQNESSFEVGSMVDVLAEKLGVLLFRKCSDEVADWIMLLAVLVLT